MPGSSDFSIALRLKTIVEGQQQVREVLNALEQSGTLTEEQTRRLNEYRSSVSGTEAALSRMAAELGLADDELQDVSESANRADTNLGETSTAVDAVGEAWRRFNVSATESTGRVADDLERTNEELRKSESALGGVSGELDQAGDAASGLAGDLNRVDTELDQVEDGLEDVDRAQDRVDRGSRFWRAIPATLNRVRGSLRSTRESLFNLKTLVVSTAASWGLLRVAASGIDTASNYENLKLQLATLEKSAEAAEAKLAELNEEFSTAQVGRATEAYIKMRRFGLDPTTEQVRGLLDQTAALGGEQETLEGIVLALGQAWAKQKLQGEEILQLVERGVPVWDLLQQVTGKTAAELQKLSEKGQLSRDVISGLIDEMGRSTEGAATAGLTTWTGLTQTLGATWERVQRIILDGGLFEFLKDGLRDITTLLEYLVASGKAQEWAEGVGQAVTNVGSYIDTALKSISGVASAIRLVVNAFSAGVKTIGAATASYFATITDGVAKTLRLFGSDEWAAQAQAVADSLSAAAEEYTKGVIEDSADLREAWDGVTSAMENTEQGIVGLVNEAREWKESTKEVAEASDKAVDGFEQAGKAAGGAAVEMAQAGGAATAAGDKFAGLGETTLTAAQALDKFGINLDAIRAGMSGDVYEAMRNFEAALKAIEESELDAAQKAEAVAAAIGSIIAKAQSSGDLEQLRARLGRLYDEGLLQGDRYKILLDQISRKHNDLATTIDQAKSALDRWYATGRITMDQYLQALRDPIAGFEELRAQAEAAGAAAADGADRATEALDREADAANRAAGAHNSRRSAAENAGAAGSSGGGGGSGGGRGGGGASGPGTYAPLETAGHGEARAYIADQMLRAGYAGYTPLAMSEFERLIRDQDNFRGLPNEASARAYNAYQDRLLLLAKKAVNFALAKARREESQESGGGGGGGGDALNLNGSPGGTSTAYGNRTYTGAPSASSAPSGAPGGSVTVRFENGGKQSTMSGSPQDVEAFLEILEEAGATATTQ